MKRAILILSGLILALVLLNQIRNPSPAPKGKIVETLKTSAALSRPKFHPPGRTVPSAPTDSTNSVSADKDDDDPQELTREQIEAYLLKTKRSPESLLNAFQETEDTNFLAEAVTKFPENSLVQLTMLQQELSPEQRVQWLEKLKASSPDNALPNYLSALDDFKAGNIDKALAEMDSAARKNYSTFERERLQSREEMLLFSGYSPLEAREQSSGALFLTDMKALAQEIGALQKNYIAAGDTASSQQLATLGIEASRKLSDENAPSLIGQMSGLAMEHLLLKNLDPATQYDFLGTTASNRIQELQSQKQEARELLQIYGTVYPGLPDNEKLIYLDRFRLYGELNAMRWFKQNYGETK